MNRSQMTILCEDKQHEAFIRRFLKKRRRRIYVFPRPGAGAAEQFVRDNYPEQLDAIRKRNGILVVMIDGDNDSIEQRLKQLDDACTRKGVPLRKDSDPVAIFVPKRNIETWLAYLDGERVNEKDKYRKLKRERECQRHVNALKQMCSEGKLRPPRWHHWKPPAVNITTFFDFLTIQICVF